MPAGIGAAGWLAIKHETTMGTYIPPSTAGTIWIPILDESLVYNTDHYYSNQIRGGSPIAQEAKPGYYSVGGDVTMEFDSQFFPYFGYISRHTIVKTGAGTPWTYDFAPSAAGAASTAAGATNPKTASITIVRNGVGFGYSGCVCGGFEFTIDSGNLRCTLHVVGLAEQLPAGLGTPAWVASKIHGADAHSVYVAAAGTAPTFGAASTDFNGFTANFNYNGEPQNRIRADRAASYISFGETEVTYDTELDFLSRAEFDNYKTVSKRACRLESIQDGAAWAASSAAIRIDINNSVYETYEINNGGMADLVMASVTGRALGIAGGDAAKVTVKSTADIT